MKLFSSDSFTRLEKALDYSSTKQRVISNNIANVDTPNYKSKSVSFASEFNAAKLRAYQTNGKHIAFQGGKASEITIKSNKNSSYNHNGNNVDIDKEMAEMAQNQIYYNALVDRMNGKFNSIKDVLKGGS